MSASTKQSKQSKQSELTVSTRPSLEYYLGLSYPISLYPEECGYTAEIPDLQGCLTQGESLEEAIENIAEARQLWLETAYEFGDNIPLPSTENKYSGKYPLRISPELHRKLALEAERQRISLNQYISQRLSENNALASVRLLLEQSNFVLQASVTEAFADIEIKMQKRIENLLAGIDSKVQASIQERLTAITSTSMETRHVSQLKQTDSAQEMSYHLNALTEIWKDNPSAIEKLIKLNEKPCTGIEQESYIDPKS